MTETTTALTLVIPNEFHEKINTIRAKYDRAYPRWMPHINFMFPFVEEASFDIVVETLKSTVTVKPFTINMNTVGYFKQGKNATIHLKLEDNTELKALFEVLKKALPNVTLKHESFEPHLTLAQCKMSEVADKVKEIQQHFGTGFKFQVDKVSLLSRSKTDNKVPFVEARYITLK